MKNSISKRITLITFGLISIVFLLTFLFQNMFFEEFYLSKKTESLILDVKRIKTLYSYQNFNTNNLSNGMEIIPFPRNAPRLALGTGTQPCLVSPLYRGRMECPPALGCLLLNQPEGPWCGQSPERATWGPGRAEGTRDHMPWVLPPS